MSLQKLFDDALAHARKQNCKSVVSDGADNTMCAYRGTGGRMCFVGALIPNSLYDVKFENETVCAVLGASPLLQNYFCDNYSASMEDIEIALEYLQSIHDDISTAEWEDAFSAFAHSNFLEYNLPKSI